MKIPFPRFLLAGITLFILCAAGSFRSFAQDVLIVQDERPQVEVLASFLEEHSNLDVTIVGQTTLPVDLSSYRAVIAFIHGDLKASTEQAAIKYTKEGGRFIPLHHSISSGKAENEHYFDFLGIHLDNPEESSSPAEPGGGYAWRHTESNGEGVTLTLVNLDANHYITNHDINWGDKISYTSSDAPSTKGMYSSISLKNSEIYLNHKFTDGREKTVLMGVKYHDDRNGHLFMQDRAGWIKENGKGEIIYLLPGHSASDYENKNIAQMVLNAIKWQP